MKREAITSPAEFETQCMTPTTLDVKGRIDKACTKGLPKTLTKKCSLLDVDDLIPGCASGVSAAYIDQKIECVVCLALNALDGLARDCDDFDDGVVNGSMPIAPSAPPPLVQPLQPHADSRAAAQRFQRLTALWAVAGEQLSISAIRRTE